MHAPKTAAGKKTQRACQKKAKKGSEDGSRLFSHRLFDHEKPQKEEGQDDPDGNL